jgi:hypothetical protein
MADKELDLDALNALSDCRAVKLVGYLRRYFDTRGDCETSAIFGGR